MSRKTQLAEQIITEHKALQEAAQAVESLAPTLVQQLDTALAQVVKAAENDYAQASQRAQAELAQAQQTSVQAVQSALAQAGLAAAPWTAAEWNTYAPSQDGFPPELLRVGELRSEGIRTRLPSLPALLPLAGQRHFLISFDDAQAGTAAGILESLAWRIAALSAPGTYHFVLCDPLDRGSNLDSLLHLPESIRGAKIWCDDQDIEGVLARLDAENQEVIQKRLLSTYPDIEAYNTANPDVAVPYRFLIWIGFPKGFTPKAADLLSSVARSGQRAGCYIIGGVMRGERPPHGFDFTAFMKLSTYASVKKPDCLEWNDPEFAQLLVRPDSPPPAALIDRLARAIEPLALASASTTIPFRRLAVRKANWWQASSVDGLEAVIGLDESGDEYKVNIGSGVTHHALVGGATGTGKTNLLHLLVLMLGTTYSPDELELYLVDFKEGVEFQDYVAYGYPHAGAVLLEAEREFGLSVLQRLVEEMERRSQAFKAVGVSELQDHRARTGQLMPRILLIMDEYVVLFGEDDRLSFQASEALGSLVMRGRSFGIHVLLSAQRPASTFLSMSHIKSQMGLRVALKCRPEDSTLILGEGNERAARLTRSGESCVTSDPDSTDATAQVRIARVEPDERALYLKGLREFARLKRYARKMPTIVFSRDAPAVWSESHAVAQRLAAPQWAPLPAPLFWLGQPLRIADDLSVTVDSHQGNNLLVLGSDETLAMRLLTGALLGLGLTAPPQTVRFEWIGTVDPQQAVGGTLVALREAMPHDIEVQSRQAAVDTLNGLLVELDERLSHLPARPDETIFLVVAGLHRWLEVRGPNAYTPSPSGEQLARLLQQGPEVSIHTLMWCDRLNTLGAVVGSGTTHDALAQFAHRVALQMNSDESVNFVGGPYAAKLGGERAYYRNEQWPADVLDKFKPYALLSPMEASSVAGTMKTRWG